MTCSPVAFGAQKAILHASHAENEAALRPASHGDCAATAMRSCTCIRFGTRRKLTGPNASEFRRLKDDNPDAARIQACVSKLSNWKPYTLGPDDQQLGPPYVHPWPLGRTLETCPTAVVTRQHPLSLQPFPQGDANPQTEPVLRVVHPKIVSAYQHNGRSLGQTVNVCRRINFLQLSNICAAHRFTSNDGTSSV